eukprot:m.44694 g.44694  ORF g.44694 m.44694 type:complete len:453 (+) comp5838_c0_seq2:22-1380(+)
MSAKEEGQGQDLWHAILSDVASHTASRRLPARNLLVLGEEGAGKTSLIARLQGRKHQSDENSLGSGLEYTYIDVKDEDGGEDVIGRLGVYTLDGSTDQRALLQFVVNKETLDSLVVVVVVDMLRPWQMLESLDHALKTLEAHVASLNVPQWDDMKKKVVQDYQSFTESGTAPAEDSDDIILPLEEGVLTTNLGVPVLVICNKSDGAAVLEKDLDYRNEHFDFIQMHLRKACLKYGAALVYNGKDGKTRDALLRYIYHMAYGTPFAGKANIAERDSVFIPAGWDNAKRVAMLHAGLKNLTPDDKFEDHIVSLQPRKANPTRDVEALNEQEFLKKQQQILSSNPTSKDPEPPRRSAITPSAPTARASGSSSPLPPSRGSSGTAPAAAPAAKPATPASASPAAPGTPGKTADGKPAQSTDVLAHFFNSLLKKPGAGGAAGAAGGAAAPKPDAPKS